MSPVVAIVLHEPAVGGAATAVLRPIPFLEREGWRFCFWAPQPSAVAELLQDRGYEVSGEPRQLRYSRIALREPPGTLARVRSAPGYLWRFRRFVDRKAPDVVHANSILTVPEAMVARARGAATLLHVHEVLSDGAQATFATRLARLTDRVVAVSEACAAQLHHRGVDAGLVTAGIPSIRLEPRHRNRRLVVGTLGTVSRRKGSDLFVAAASGILEHRDDVEFRMVGPLAGGPDEPWARAVVERAERRGVRWHTTTEPMVELGRWDIFVLPTRQDPFPLAVLEAMASGLPVVATEVDGVPEQVDATSGILVGPEDAQAISLAVEALLDDSSRREAMGRAGAARISERFTPERNAHEMACAYRAAIAAAAVRRSQHRPLLRSVRRRFGRAC